MSLIQQSSQPHHLIIRIFSGCLNLSGALGTPEMIKADEIEAASDKKRVMSLSGGQHWGEETTGSQTGLVSDRGNRIHAENRERETGYKLSWTHQWNVTSARSFSERYEQIVTGVQSVAIMATGVEIPFWIFGQQKWVSGINRNTTCQEVSVCCVSRRNLRGRMGWEYAKMFPWLISDHVHCVSSYAQIRIVISKGKKV